MMLLANQSAWPNGLDLTVTVTFLAIALLVPAAGYVFMVLDFRAYLRSLRRTLVVVSNWRDLIV